MELLQLKYFCAAAQTENFSKTAAKFTVPVSNISQSIKRLEKELGKELFFHNGNRVQLNNEGKQFYSYAQSALTLLDEGREKVLQSLNKLSGDIRLVCTNNYKAITVAIEKFIKKHPDVNFVIYHSLDKNEDFDVLISDGFPNEYGKKIFLFEEEIMVAMKKKHRLSDKKSVSVKNLENEHFIALSSSESLKNIMVSACRAEGFSPNFAVQTYSTSFMRRYIEIGLGISFVPASWSKKYSNEIEFKRIEGLPKRKTYALLSKKSIAKRAATAFIETLEEEIKESRL